MMFDVLNIENRYHDLFRVKLSSIIQIEIYYIHDFILPHYYSNKASLLACLFYIEQFNHDSVISLLKLNKGLLVIPVNIINFQAEKC